MAAGVSCDAKERRMRASKGLCMNIGGTRSKADRGSMEGKQGKNGRMQVSMQQWVAAYLRKIQ